MDDNLISEPESNKGGNEACSDKKSSDKRTQNSKKNLGSEHRNGFSEPKSSLAFSAILFLVIEAAAFILWQIADSLTGYVGVFFHWLSLVCISIGPLPAIREAVKREKRWWLWFAFVIVWLLLAIVAFIIWRPHMDSKSYESLAPDVTSNIVKALNEPDSRIYPAVVLVYPVNPDESAYALAEQLKKIFWDGGFVIVSGLPPPDIPEIPGVSCFLYGYAAGNAGMWRALSMIINTTKSHTQIAMEPGGYPGTWRPIILNPIDHPQSAVETMRDFRKIFDAEHNATNSVVVIMIRKK